MTTMVLEGVSTREDRPYNGRAVRNVIFGNQLFLRSAKSLDAYVDEFRNRPSDRFLPISHC